MAWTKNPVWVVMTCALAIMCAVVCVPGANGAEVNWIALGSGAYHTPANWDTGNPPTSTDDAKHDTKSNHIEVQQTSDACLSFEGRAGSVDRYLLIQSDKKLAVGSGGVQNDPTAAVAPFIVRLQDGTSSPNTRVAVNGDVTEIGFFPYGNDDGDYVNIDIAGDTVDTSLTLGDSCTIDVDGDWGEGGVTLGTSSATAGTKSQMTVGSIGTVLTEGIDDSDWLLRGYTELTVEGDAVAKDLDSVFEQRNNSKMTVGGEVYEAIWRVYDNSEFTATAGAGAEGGTWEIENTGAADLRTVSGGDWTVTSDGHGALPGLRAVTLSPENLTVDGGTVT